MQLHNSAPQLLQRHSSRPLQRPPLTVKPGLVHLINKHHLSMIKLAQTAHVQVDVVHAMALHGEAVQPVIAVQVLRALNALSGAHYTLNDIDITLCPYATP